MLTSSRRRWISLKQPQQDDTENSRGSSEYLSTLEKGLRVLTVFSREHPRMTLTEVAKATSLSPAVARRCLLTLHALGYVGKEDNSFMLKPAVLELSTPFIESFNVDNVIRPPLQHLRNTTGDSASFAVVAGSDVLYITHVSTYRVIRLQASTGTRFPAVCTSLGRAILSCWQEHELDAFLFRHPISARTDKTVTEPNRLKTLIQEAAEQGYAIVSDELDYGITSIACPIVLPGHGVVGAINSSASTGSVDLDTFADSRLPALNEVRLAVTEELKQAPDLVRAIHSQAH